MNYPTYNKRVGDYMVHFVATESQNQLEFSVYPVNDYSGSTGSGIAYIDKSNEQSPLITFDEENALCKMQGTYCWRGVWEGRLYFPDKEYWSEELKELSDMFSSHIETFCKEFIKSLNPNATDD